MKTRCIELKSLDKSAFQWSQFRRTLETEFSSVETNREIGILRERMRLKRQLKLLRQLKAPKQVLEYQKSRIKKASVELVYQVSVYDGKPLRDVLDLTFRRDGILCHFTAQEANAADRCVRALQCSVAEVDVERTNERRSSEERRYWDRCKQTQRLVSQQLGSLEGTECLFVSELGNITRTRLSDCQVDPRCFLSSIEVIPTLGLQSELRMKGIRWSWGDFSVGERIWIRGPYVIEKLIFGKAVSDVVCFCETLPENANPREHRQHLKSIIRQALEYPLV